MTQDSSPVAAGVGSFTPGPWRYSEPHETYGVVWAGKQPIADVCIADLRTPVETANARLIAAAPDLLAALQSVLAEYEDGYGLRCVDSVRAALSKARSAS